MKKRFGKMTADDIARADQRLRMKNPNAQHGSSKHRGARIQKYVHKNKRKRGKR